VQERINHANLRAVADAVGKDKLVVKGSRLIPAKRNKKE
jgi:hypothetical protein